jgi:hypothetical protein
MDLEGNPHYESYEPNVYVLSQSELSTIYQQVLDETRSSGQSNFTETLFLNLINTKLDECQLCIKLRRSLTSMAKELSNTINSLRPMEIPNDKKALPYTIIVKIRLLSYCLSSRRLAWHHQSSLYHV